MTIFNVFSLLGGLALFLFGMDIMGKALEKQAGGQLQKILSKLTDNPLKGFFLGLCVTAVIQSSSATTVMVVGFVNSGIMELHQAIGVIMGSNVGTTVTSWILSLSGLQGDSLLINLLKPTSFSPLLAFIGILLYMCKSEKKKGVGTILIGFAVLMTGMTTMSNAVLPLQNEAWFTSLFTRFSNPLLGVLVGALVTGIIQSSSASVGILQALSATGVITYGSAIPIIMGLAEMNFLSGLSPEKRYEALDQLFRQQPPAVIVCRSEELTPFPEMQELAQKHGVALLRSNETTCTLMGSLISVLNLELAPRITRHGVLVEVYGEGILILGDSGIGKSELAIELVKRGHRLVADDAVELRKVSNRQIMGTAPENIRHFIELRGIGIVNVARVYGVGAVKLSESLDLVVQLEAWDPTKNYQRTGLENEYYDILGVSIPSTSIPVSPGRNLAVVLETAAINNRQKKMGYNAARELLIRLGLDDKMD